MDSTVSFLTPSAHPDGEQQCAPDGGALRQTFAQAAQLSLAAAPRRCSGQTPNPRNEADSPNKEPSEKFRINVLHALRLKVFFCQ